MWDKAVGIFQKHKMINKVLLLDIQLIESNPFQPRKEFDEKALEELAQSISENGLLQPITVRACDNGQFQLIAGERRLKACTLLGRTTIPAIVEQVNDESSALFALIENLQRRDLNFFEQAEGIARMMEQTGMTQEQAAVSLGKAQPTVANKLRLLIFSEPMREMILRNGLTERHARALLRLPDEKVVAETLEHIVKERLNVGESERYIQSIIEKQNMQSNAEPAPTPQTPPTRLFVVKDMRVFLNTIAKAVTTMKQAGIEIDTDQREDEEYIHVSMKIPKKSAYRAQSHSA